MDQYTEQSEQSVDRSMDQDDGRWLTYPELAAVRQIDKPSAIRLATRKKWRRQRDNRRVVRVLVPPEWLSRRYQSLDLPMEQQDQDMDLSSDRADVAVLLAAVEAAHAGEVNALLGQVAGLTTRAEAADRRAERAEEQADTLRDKLETLHTDLTTARTLQVETEAAMQVRIQAAQDALAVLRQAEADRKARGLLARLGAAVRGN